MKSSNKKNGLTNIILLFFIGTFIYSAYQIYLIYSDYHQAETVYEELSASLVKVNNQEKPEKELTYLDYQIDFDGLMDTNDEVIAWIRFDEPATINYPIMDANNNDAYIRTNIHKEYNTAGTLFIEEDNEGLSDDNTIIYGHNMKNGTMFGQLSSYRAEVFYQKYPYFYIYTPDGMAYKYEIIGASEISVEQIEYYVTNFASEEAMLSYAKMIVEATSYDTLNPADIHGPFITLSTCAADTSRRFVVQGMLIEEGKVSFHS